MSTNRTVLPTLSGCFDSALTSICKGQEPIMCCEFSPDGSLIAVGTSTGTVTVYQTSTGNRLYFLPNVQDPSLPVTSVRFYQSKDTSNNILLVSYSSGHVCHWHVSTKKCLTTVKEERHTLAVQFAPDYLTFATTGSNAKIIVYDEPTNAIKTVLEPSSSPTVMDGHMSRIFALVYHPHDCNILVSAGWDNTVQFWDTRQSYSVRKIVGPHVCGDALDIAPSSLDIVTGSWRHHDSIQVWDFHSGKLLTTVQPGFESKLYAACWLSNDTILAGGSQDNIAAALQAKTSKVLGQVSDLDNGVYGIAVHQNKVAVAAGGNLYIMIMNKLI